MGEIIVAAGVNGAGKSSIVGELHKHKDAAYYNPDLRTRQLMAEGAALDEANSRSWQEGYEALKNAIDTDTNFTFETTLGGETITSELLRALAMGRAVTIYFVGLDSAERHIQRVRERVARGGHDIPEAKIRQRFVSSHANLRKFIGTRAKIAVYDNSSEDKDGVPVPVTVLKIAENNVTFPKTAEDLAGTPDWAKPVVQLAMQRCEISSALAKKIAATPGRPTIRIVK